MTDTWPTFAQELGRKITDQVKRWSDNYAAGKITTKEFFIAISAMEGSTSGMVPPDIRDMLSEINKELRGK